MKLLDIFADKLLETKLMEMAVSRKDAISELLAKQRPLNEHLIKYLYFEDQAKQHWITEIKSYLYDIDGMELKPDNKRIKSSMYFEYLFEAYFGHGSTNVGKWVKRFTIKDYSTCQKSGLSIEQVWWAMKQFFEWLCPMMEKDIFDDTQVQIKLDDLKQKAITLQ